MMVERFCKQPREVDEKELEAVKKFVENACGCPELLKD